MADDFKLDPEFKDLLPRHDPAEKKTLRKLIKATEHVDQGVVGIIHGERILVDGYTRQEICHDEGIPFPTRDMHFEDRESAMLWMLDNQHGRRNFTDEQRSYVRGKEYILTKQKRGGSSNRHGDGLGKTTAEVIGEKNKVSEKTVERDAAFAKGADALSPEAKAKVLGGKSGQSRKEIATAIFCPRCTRNGPSKKCETCDELRAEAGKKKKAAKAKPKSGEVKFDWKKWEASFGDQVRQIDRLAKLSEKSKDSPRPESLRATLSMFRAEFRQTYREFTGLKPPSE